MKLTISSGCSPCLPHRYPFLLVDRIVEARGDEFCIGIKNVTFNEPQFQGHFPGAAGHARRAADRGHGADGGRPVRREPAGAAAPSLVYLMTIDKAKFRKPVTPGDQVRVSHDALAKRRNMWWYRGEAKVDGALVCEATISAMLVDE